MSPLHQKRYTPIQRNDRNRVGRVVQKLREAQNLTRVELAARAQVNRWDISLSVVKRIESGEREVTDIELVKLAKALRVPASVLVDMI